jgi:short-subunit dehydrogenase
MAPSTALITGASSGIGAELARVCAAHGHNVVLVARREPELRALAAAVAKEHGVEARVLTADLADPAAPRAIFQAMAGANIDLLINNAGFGLRGDFADSDWEIQARMIQVNIAALAHLTRLFLPAMIARGSGRILNVGSTAGFVPGPCMSVYYASKAFVLSFSEALAEELRGTGVAVTDLCPGPTRTGFGLVAGMANTKLFHSATMSAEAVAREGYHAMMQGRTVAIAGARNRWAMRGARLMSRRWLAGLVKRYNSPAKGA